MEADRLSQLIGLIYDSAVDLDLWPLLLQGLSEELDANFSEPGGEGRQRLSSHTDSIEKLGEYVNRWYEGELGDGALSSKVQLRHFEGEQAQLIRMLLPHFIRALNINRQFVELTAENQAFSSVLDRLPIGMAMIGADGRLYAKNRRLDEMLKQECGLTITKGRLLASQLRDADTYIQSLAEVAADAKTETVGRAIRLSGAMPSSVMILPLMHDEHLQISPKLMVFVSSLMGDVHIDPKSLQDFFGLTKAESRLTLALVNGSDLNEISERFHVTKNTLRAQLRSVYAKTECSRQAELVVKVLTSPVIVSGMSEDISREPWIPLGLNEQPRPTRLDQYLFLSDGRRLSFAEYGPKDGYPTIMMHTITGSRLQIPPDESCLYTLGIRIIAPERPGFGLSDSKPERTIVDWSHDVEELADCLGLQRFAVMAFSVGGCFAMAVARAFPQRVSHLVLIGAMANYENVEELDGVMPLFRMLLGMGRFMPAISMSFLKLMLRSIRKSPEKYYDRILEQLPVRDREILARPDIRKHYLNSMQEAVRLGERDLMLEHLMVLKDWGFSASEVEVPTTIWHGDEDRHVPVHMARSLQQQIPNAHLKVLPGAGHFLMYPYWQEIIEDMAHNIQVA